MVMQTTCKDKDLFANIGFYAAFLFGLIGMTLLQSKKFR
jgi:hypothetical protein